MQMCGSGGGGGGSGSGSGRGRGSVRTFSSMGMGGSRGGGSMVDITAGSLPGDDPTSPRLSVRGYGEGVFQVNETLVHGSVILLPKTYYIWEATKFEDITVESLAMFTLIYPTIEVLFIGELSR